MINLDSILKSRDITLPTKVHLVKTMVFPVVMYGCKSWTIKKAECQRIDTFELWCWRRLLRVPWTGRRWNPKENHSSIFFGRTDAEAETPPDAKNGLIGKDPDARRDWRWEEKGTTEDEMVGWSLTWWIWVWASSRSWWWIGSLACCSPLSCKELDTTEGLNWTDNHGQRSQNWYRDSDIIYRNSLWGLPVAQLVKNPLAILETQVQFLGWWEALEKG